MKTTQLRRGSETGNPGAVRNNGPLRNTARARTETGLRVRGAGGGRGLGTARPTQRPRRRRDQAASRRPLPPLAGRLNDGSDERPAMAVPQVPERLLGSRAAADARVP